MEKWVIRALKASYCSFVVKRQLQFIDACKEIVDVRILDTSVCYSSPEMLYPLEQ